MAQPPQTGNPIVSAEPPLFDLLSAPLSSDWTVEQLAEDVLSATAERGTNADQEFVLDVETAANSQSRRLIRPLLACLATKSAAEAGTCPNLYGGWLSYQRPGHQGPVWILGQFENKPGAARVVFRRSSSAPQDWGAEAPGASDGTERIKGTKLGAI
jgi:hypothetical protein